MIHGLIDHGRHVTIATPQLDVASLMLRGSGAAVIAAPALGYSPGPGRISRSFAEILANTCFRDSLQIQARCATWLSIFARVQPDVIVCEHAPTALLAARATSIPLISCGTGFTLPDAVSPYPDLRPELKTPAEVLLRLEEATLRNLNAWLVSVGAAPLPQLSSLYHDSQAQLLTTLPALDWYAPRRRPATYVGVWPSAVGKPCDWPDYSGKRVLAYLKPFVNLVPLLEKLRDARDGSTIVVCPGIDPKLRTSYARSRVLITSDPIDLTQALALCDIAIGHGTHGFTAQAMIAGKPQLMIPFQLEQRLTAERVQHFGAGRAADYRDSGDIFAKLHTVLADAAFSERALHLKIACAQAPVQILRDALEIIGKQNFLVR